MTTEKNVERKYHWMVAAQVAFVLPGHEDGSVISMNTMLLTDEPQVNYKDMARVQHSLRVSLDQRFDAAVDLKDIVFLSFSNLGYMSEPTFQAGMNDPKKA